jgi:hypothetical protein
MESTPPQLRVPTLELASATPATRSSSKQRRSLTLTAQRALANPLGFPSPRAPGNAVLNDDMVSFVNSEDRCASCTLRDD